MLEQLKAWQDKFWGETIEKLTDGAKKHPKILAEFVKMLKEDTKRRKEDKRIEELIYSSSTDEELRKELLQISEKRSK